MARLTCEKPFNKPTRLCLQCDYADKSQALAVGHGVARWSKTRQAWTYPLDPTVLREILDVFPDVQLSQELRDMSAEKARQQENLRNAVRDTRLIFPDDRLWAFQRGSVRFLAEAKRCILGHEMGTGKTVIAAAAIKYLGLGRILIVCTNAVKWSWVDHLREWGDFQDIYVLESAKQSRADVRAKILTGATAEKREEMLYYFFNTTRQYALIINYDQARELYKALHSTSYDALIVDEAHRIKNKKALCTEAVRKIAQKTIHVWLITGTPVRNSHTDLWSLLNICDSDRFSSFWNFIDIYFNTVPGVFGGVEILGLRDTILFTSMLTNYMFAKSKVELLPDLPLKLPPVEYRLKMVPKQYRIYEEMENEFLTHVQEQIEGGGTLDRIISAPNTIAKIIRLRQICLTPDLLVSGSKKGRNSAKLAALLDLLEDLYDQRKQFIVYTCFREFIPYIEQITKELHVPYGVIVGGQSSQDRDAIQRALTKGDIQAVLGTIQSMGEGMNLQAAKAAVFCDIDWVPGVNAQAEDRIHRLGITESPTIIHLYHPGTVESDIRAVCKRKEAMVNETVGKVEVVREMLMRRGYGV